jgi:ketosteroid isomerase-like protein
MSAVEIRKTLNAFVAAFNENDLDRVMSFFAEDAIYLPGNGTEHRGIAAIRKEFEPQFRGRFGSMTFDEHELLIDEAARKAVSRWTCRHDISGDRGKKTSLVQRLGLRLVLGSRFGWEGLDVFHLNEHGKIEGKFTYANYRRPLLKREAVA